MSDQAAIDLIQFVAIVAIAVGALLHGIVRRHG